MAVPNYSALVLNADFSPVTVHPLSTWGFERTLRNVLKDRVTVLEEHDVILRSPSFEYRPPSVIALKEYVSRPQRVAFTRRNIFLRDDFRCAYCGERFHPRDLTFDHVIPASKGGPTNFENIVSACVPCNTRKGNKNHMKPLWDPYVPTSREMAKRRPPDENLHASWMDYLYWSGVLEQN